MDTSRSHRPRPRHRGTPRPTLVPALASVSLLAVSGSATIAAIALTVAAESSLPDSAPSLTPAAVQATEPPAGDTPAFSAPTSAPPTLADQSRTGAATARAVVKPMTAGQHLRPIPVRALTAYQRSETILGKASPRCGLDWTLLAAIGGVLTDHGERGGKHTIDDNGTIQPSIIGPPLRAVDGHEVSDTDGGALDGDPLHDRPVGPLLFDPSVWTIVGVDSDGDGRRDPQDLDDAALAGAVLLCSAEGDLSRDGDARTALLRLGIADATADQVLATAAEYRRGDHQPLPSAPMAPVHELQTPSSALPEQLPTSHQDGDPHPADGSGTDEVPSGKLNEMEEEIEDDVDVTEPVDADELHDPSSEPEEKPSPTVDDYPADSQPDTDIADPAEADEDHEQDPKPEPQPEPDPGPEPAPETEADETIQDEGGDTPSASEEATAPPSP